MSAADGSYVFLHFLRSGRWTVPLWHDAGTHASAGARWEVRKIDYWSKSVTVLTTLAADARSAVIDVTAIPGNYEIARISA